MADQSESSFSRSIPPEHMDMSGFETMACDPGIYDDKAVQNLPEQRRLKAPRRLKSKCKRGPVPRHYAITPSTKLKIDLINQNSTKDHAKEDVVCRIITF